MSYITFINQISSIIDFTQLVTVYDIKKMFDSFDSQKQTTLLKADLMGLLKKCSIIYGRNKEEVYNNISSYAMDLFKKENDALTWVEFINNEKIISFVADNINETFLKGFFEDVEMEENYYVSKEALRLDKKERELEKKQKELNKMERELSEKERMISYLMDSLKERELNLEDRELEFHRTSRNYYNSSHKDDDGDVRDFTVPPLKKEGSFSQAFNFFKKKEQETLTSPREPPKIKKSGSFMLNLNIFTKDTNKNSGHISELSSTPIRKLESARIGTTSNGTSPISSRSPLWNPTGPISSRSGSVKSPGTPDLKKSAEIRKKSK